ncbi:hypothetical protein [Janthinobacterium tructae]|nr:hypothetical protein [Janthinobacterium tructae]
MADIDDDAVLGYKLRLFFRRLGRCAQSGIKADAVKVLPSMALALNNQQ